MKNNNLVVIERDVFCPYCNQNSAVLISETIKKKKTIGCAAIGCKDALLLYVTGCCWAIVCGFPLLDVREDNQTSMYGFCPCCGNTYPVIKPEAETVIDKMQNTQKRISKVASQAKGLLNKSNTNHDQIDYDSDDQS